MRGIINLVAIRVLGGKMTVNNVARSQVTFALFWAGERSWQNVTISQILINFRQTASYFLANVDQNTTASKVQQLELEMISKNNIPCDKKKPVNIVDLFECTPTIAKTMKLSATITSSQGECMIPMTLPKLQPGKHYNIYVQQTKQNLKATCTQGTCSPEAILKKQSEPVRRAFENKGFSAGISAALDLEDLKLQYFCFLCIARACTNKKQFADAELALSLVPDNEPSKKEQQSYYELKKPKISPPLQPHFSHRNASGSLPLSRNKSFSNIGKMTNTPFPHLSTALSPERSPAEQRAWDAHEGEEQPEG